MRSVTGMTPEFAAPARPQGVTPPSGRSGRVLSDVIVELGFADRETVDQALGTSREAGKKLGTILFERGTLSERELGRAVAEAYGLPFLDLSDFDIDPEAVHVIGEAEMTRYDAVPVAFTEDGALVVAMIDPADWLAAEEMAQLTGRRIRRAVAAPSEVTELIRGVAQARSGGDGADGRGSGADGSSTMPLRLMLRPVTNPLAGRALGREFGAERPLSEGSTSEGRSTHVSTGDPAQRAGPDRAAAHSPARVAERRVIPLTSRTVREEPLTRDTERALHDPAGARAETPALDTSNDDGGAAPDQPGARADEVRAGLEALEEIRGELARALAELDRTHAALARVRDRLEALKSA